MTRSERVRIAAFDFDGTLSRRDTLVPFLVRTAGPARFGAIAAGLGAAGITRRLDGRDRDAVKAAVLDGVLAGRTVQEMTALGDRYARGLVANQLRDAVLVRLREHLDRGDHVLFVSASLRFYLQPVADILGVHDVIAVEMADQDGVLTGAMRGPNVRAEQKAIRLQEWLEARGLDRAACEIWAYGNSSGDHELLAMADHGAWVGRAKDAPPRSSVFVTERLG